MSESWYEMIKECADGDEIIQCTLSEERLHHKFDTGYGGEEGDSFTAWSEEWVYFPVGYDGAEWVGRVPRNPCDHECSHVGGG